jgi:parvulin-like peptidyl-prolyl isomerase
MHARSRLVAILAALVLAMPASAQEPPAVRATVNGDAITAADLEARQFDLIGKDTIVKAVQEESQQLGRHPAVAQELKRLLAAVVQENPEGTREQIRAAVQEKAVVFTDTLAVRRVKPKLFADVEAKAMDQLVDEQLMLQEAKRQGVTADEVEVDKLAEGVAKRAGADGEPLHKLLVAWDKRALPGAKARLRADLGWKAALQKRLGANAEQDFAAVSARELAALKASAKIAQVPAEPAAQTAPAP